MGNGTNGNRTHQIALPFQVLKQLATKAPRKHFVFRSETPGCISVVRETLLIPLFYIFIRPRGDGGGWPCSGKPRLFNQRRRVTGIECALLHHFIELYFAEAKHRGNDPKISLLLNRISLHRCGRNRTCDRRLSVSNTTIVLPVALSNERGIHLLTG